MKYPIDKELRLIAQIKVPKNIKMAALASKGTEVFQCKSDDKVRVWNHRIKSFDGALVETLIIEPKGVREKLPCLVLFHGGGFVMGSSAPHYQIAKEYAEKLPCRVIYPEYRLIPKNKFPVPAEDCFAAYKWAVEYADDLGIDSNRIYVGGDSAGGNLAAAVTLMARDRGLKIPDKAMLIYPATDRRMITESMKEFVDTPVWDARRTKMIWEEYLGYGEVENIEYASPAEARSLDQFPDTYMEVAEFDCLRDEGIMFANKLKIAGSDVELHEIKAACHGYEAAFNSRITRECMVKRVEWLRK